MNSKLNKKKVAFVGGAIFSYYYISCYFNN